MIGYGEIIIILCVILLLFGGKRLPELARSLGLGIKEFKKAIHGDDLEKIDDKSSHDYQSQAQSQSQPRLNSQAQPEHQQQSQPNSESLKDNN